MLTCQSCGGTNPSHATQCEYCDQPLAGKKLVDVAWSSHTSEGATGQGRVSVETPGDTDTERVRALVEAAFASTVDGLGPNATQVQVQADMEQRLRTLLPAEYTLHSIELTAYSAFLLVAEPPKPQPSSGGLRTVLLLGFMISLCCVLTSSLCVVSGLAEQRRANVIGQAKVLDPSAPGGASGWVCIEATVARVSSPLLVKGPPLEDGGEGALISCLYQLEVVVTESLETHKRTDGSEWTETKRDSESTTRIVREFALGKVMVRPDDTLNTSWLRPEILPFRKEGQQEYRNTVVRTATPLTVVGVIRDGVIEPGGGEALSISSARDRAGLERQLRDNGETSKQIGYIGLVVGILLAFLTFFIRRKT